MSGEKDSFPWGVEVDLPRDNLAIIRLVRKTRSPLEQRVSFLRWRRFARLITEKERRELTDYELS